MKITPDLIKELVSNQLSSLIDLREDAPISVDIDEAPGLTLPRFSLSEKWGEPTSADRQIIEKFFSKIRGESMQEKINNIQGFITDCDAACINATNIPEILANLVFLDSLAALIEDFNDKSGGFLFESLVSALLGGQSRQVPTVGGRNIPIEDLVDSDGKTPLSLKFFFEDPYKKVSGSHTNLVRGISKYQMPITYVVGMKTRQGDNVMALQFFQFTVGDEMQNIEGDFDASDFKSGIPYSQFKDYKIASLDFGSRRDLRAIGEKYASRLGERVITIYDQLALLTGNINTYFLEPENKTAGTAAAQNAVKLAQKVSENT